MNELFLKQMQELLKDEYPAYFACLDQKPQRGYRINTLKTTPEELFSILDLPQKKTPFCKNGYYMDERSGIGRTPEYMAGAFYMQEPSASSAVTVLNPIKGMKVLDLCAAPGSKSTQIAEALDHEGLLVANEINPTRCRILVENIERHGCDNVIVCNSDTGHIADQFEGFFDAVLCDAPCSGEGMMRKEEEAGRQWSMELIDNCARLQKEILHNAWRCLRPGGTLVYSTCTLNEKENELQILQFLKDHPDMHMEDAGARFGRRGLISERNVDLSVRIFPMDGGEGHFIARMHKDGDEPSSSLSVMKSDAISKEALKQVNALLEKTYPYYFMKQGRLYGGNCPFYDTGKVRLARHQVLIGEEKKGRFEFAHSFFMSAHSPFRNQIDMNEEECRRYLHGEQIERNVSRGWYAMCYHGFVLGGAKGDGRVLKNKYPKSLRLR